MKQKCAKKAMELIHDGMVIGLGGGSTVALLIQEIHKSGRSIQAVTPSHDTLSLCIRHQIPVLPLEMTDTIDIAFDGCDELDADLNALKSCGGIHTREKIAACMAKEYVLLADVEKWKKQLTFTYPVTVEVIRAAVRYVTKRLEQMGAHVKELRADRKTGILVSDDGNYLLEAGFLHVQDAGKLAAELDGIPGVVGHSLFYQIATMAMIAKEDGPQIVVRNKEMGGVK